MNHRWNLENRITACDSPDGNERTERTCPYCKWVRITVHPPHGGAYRKWRSPDGIESQGNTVPEACTGGGDNVIDKPREMPAI